MNEQTRKTLELAREAIKRGAWQREDKAIAAIDAALSAPAAQMSHLETIATFHTAKAGRTEVATFFREHLKRHDFSDYIMTTLAADFACALAPTLHALRIDSPAAPVAHADDLAVDSLAAAMKAKLADARAKGRSGWQTCRPEVLSEMLRDHVEKGDVRDVANFCAFLWSLGSGITAPLPGSEAFDRWVGSGMGLQPAPAAPVAQPLTKTEFARLWRERMGATRFNNYEWEAKQITELAHGIGQGGAA